MMKDLQDGVLVLSDLEIGDSDVDVICKFMNHSQVSLLDLTMNYHFQSNRMHENFL